MNRCWAYSPDGTNRCELDAGHEEDHTTFRIWTDDQCWQPTAKPAPVAAPTPATTYTPPPVVPPPTPAEPADIKCVACSHKHRSGECRCGCREFIG